MLTREENELLCRIGPQAPMGMMMRRYWIPALMSDELERDGAPKRVRLLGEDFVAFRDTNGQVGLLDPLCPHRGAALALGRNGDCGLRCLYHGWKIDTAGAIIDTPAEPEGSRLKEQVRAVAYPIYEAGGLIWAYLGPKELKPQPPAFAFTALPASHGVIVKARIACNWAQCLEGVIDSAHTNFLHTDTFKPAAGLAVSDYKGASLLVERPSNDGRPRLEIEDKAYGFRYAAIRKPVIQADKNAYIRVTHFVAPFYGIFPGQKDWGTMQAFVPIDDESTFLYFVRYRPSEAIDDQERQRQVDWSGFRVGVDLDSEFRIFRNRANNWLQDRAAMKRGESFSGVQGVQIEDAMIQESMGPIYDRTKEHLGTADLAVVRMRRMMLGSVRRFQESGATPLGLGEPIDYAALEGAEMLLPLGASWQTARA